MTILIGVLALAVGAVGVWGGTFVRSRGVLRGVTWKGWLVLLGSVTATVLTLLDAHARERERAEVADLASVGMLPELTTLLIPFRQVRAALRPPQPGDAPSSQRAEDVLEDLLREANVQAAGTLDVESPSRDTTPVPPNEKARYEGKPVLYQTLGLRFRLARAGLGDKASLVVTYLEPTLAKRILRVVGDPFLEAQVRREDVLDDLRNEAAEREKKGLERKRNDAAWKLYAPRGPQPRDDYVAALRNVLDLVRAVREAAARAGRDDLARVHLDPGSAR